MRGKEKSRQRRPDGVIVLALAAAGLMSASGSWAASFNFTTDTDWATGVLTNTTGNPPPNAGDGHVRLVDNLVTPFNYIWVAASGRGTAIRIDTDVNPAIIGDGDTFLTTSEASGTAVKGEYYTAPSGRAKNPSRTTVDLNGDVWVANRDESSGGLGSAAKISSNPTGTTSNGIFNSGANGGVAGTYNALPWTNAGGADNNGGTSTATDSAQMLYVRTAGTNARTIAVDANNDVWVGGYGDREHQLYHGDTGAAISPIKNFGPNSGYGGVIDGNGVLWSSGWSNTSLSRYDPATGIETNPNVGGGSYGLAVDNDGNIWNTHFSWNTVSKLDPNGAVLFTKSSGGSQSRGVAVTPADNNIWIANSASDTVTRLDTNGNVLQTISVGDLPTGVAVDSKGKVWVTNFSDSTVMRIDPATNLVDLTVDLGSGATPYNYSDMTGSVSVGVTNPSGTWRKVLNGGVGATWDQIFWNTEAEGAIPDPTGLVIEARVSNDMLNWSTYMSYDSGDLLNLAGTYLEVRATLTRPGSSDLTPVLSDLRIDYVPGQAAPEPTTISLLGASLLGLALRRRRKM